MAVFFFESLLSSLNEKWKEKKKYKSQYFNIIGANLLVFFYCVYGFPFEYIADGYNFTYKLNNNFKIYFFEFKAKKK